MWRGDSEANLISLMEEKRVIWCLRHPQHKNTHILDKCWNEIANALGRSIKDVKAKWSTLVKTMKKEIKKIPKTKSGQAAQEYKSLWVHFQRMRFIISDLEYKKSSGNVTEFLFSKKESNFEKDVSKGETNDLMLKLDSEKSILANQAVSIDNEPESLDEDIIFFTTLLPDIRTISRMSKLKLRQEITSVVMKYISNESSNFESDEEDCVIVNEKLPHST